MMRGGWPRCSTLARVGCVGVVLLVGRHAFAQEDPRDAEIFGTPTEAPSVTTSEPGHERAVGDGPEAAPEPASAVASEAPSTATTAASGDDAIFAEGATLTPLASFEEGIAARDEALAIGGQLYLRLDSYFLEKTPAREGTLASPALLDVYFDARPNERVRAYARGRVRHDASLAGGAASADADPSALSASLLGSGALGAASGPTSVSLDQLWLKFDVGERVFVTVGRQPIRWGSGRFWNPTDFLNQQNKDPLAVFDERLGVGLVKLHLPIESLGWNLYAIGNFEGARRADDVGGALRAEMLFGETEIALSGAARTGTPERVGLDVSSALGWFDVRAEAAAQRGVTTPFFRGGFTLDPLDDQPRALSRENDWIVQATAGAELQLGYGDQDNVILGAEVFFNDAGYDSAELYPQVFIAGAYEPLFVGRHYAAAYVVLMNPGSWNNTSFTLSGIGNLSDESYLSRLDASVTLLSYVRLNGYVSAHFGRAGEFHYSLTLPPFPVEGLEDGLVVLAPAVEAGAGLTVVF